MDAVKALAFDVFGTVVDWRNGIARAVAPVLAKLGRGDVDPHAFADAWRAGYQPAMEECRSGRRPFTRLSVLHRENLDAVLRDHRITGEQLAAAERDALNAAWEKLDPWPDVAAGLARLRRRFPLVTLSNGNIALMMNLARHAGLPWDAILGAEASKHYKPVPRAYTATAEILEIHAAELCLVAAHNGDLRAARAAGLATAFVPRPAEHGPGQGSDLAAEATWDVVARDFGDLADRLGC